MSSRRDKMLRIQLVRVQEVGMKEKIDKIAEG